MSVIEATSSQEVTSKFPVIGTSTPLSPWFAVYVKHRHEKCVALSLHNRNYDVFLPTYLKLNQDSKKYELPLFPGYVFCRFDSQKTLPVLSTPGVFTIVSSGSKPVSIPDFEVEGIKQMLASGLMPRPWSYLTHGQKVCIRSGPLRGVEGLIVDDSNQKWLVVSVHILQRSVAVKINREYL